MIQNQYTRTELFAQNHLKSTQIIDQIKQGKVTEILNAIGYIKDGNVIIDFKNLKYFATPYTYDIIANYFDNIFTQLVNHNDTFNVYLNFQSLSLIDMDKHQLFCKKMATYLSDKYPDKLSKCFIYNASFVFESIIKMIKTFIDKSTLNKIVLIKE